MRLTAAAKLVKGSIEAVGLLVRLRRPDLHFRQSQVLRNIRGALKIKKRLNLLTRRREE